MQTLSELCYQIYNQRGQEAVFEYVEAKHPDLEWEYCAPCECRSPIWEASCLVCGSVVA